MCTNNIYLQNINGHFNLFFNNSKNNKSKYTENQL